MLLRGLSRKAPKSFNRKKSGNGSTLKSRQSTQRWRDREVEKFDKTEAAVDEFIQMLAQMEESAGVDKEIEAWQEAKRIRANIMKMQQEIMFQIILLSEEERQEATQAQAEMDEFRQQVRAVRRTRQRRGR